MKTSSHIPSLALWITWITMCGFSGAVDRGSILDRNGKVIATGDRRYPAAEATAHLVGKGGLEEVFDTKLSEGESLQLNVDLELQTSTYAFLKESGLRGAVVVVDPSNGEVLAMVSYPSYDPNDLVKGISEEALISRPTEGRYPPASTLKTLSSLALLEKSAAGPQTCSGESVSKGGKGMVLRCWKASGHGHIADVRAALRNSCNCYYYQAAEKCSLSDVVDVARAFGYGKPSGIEISEFAGTLPSVELGSEVETAIIGHGHMEATPLQIATAYAAVANGGTLYRPHLIAHKEPETVSTINAGVHLETVKAGLIEVVEHPEGTGRRAKIEGGMRVAGKTGTAVMADNRFAAIFAGFAPVEAPRFAICVVQEGDSTNSVSGGKTSAPLAAKILAKADALRRAKP